MHSIYTMWLRAPPVNRYEIYQLLKLPNLKYFKYLYIIFRGYNNNTSFYHKYVFTIYVMFYYSGNIIIKMKKK